MMTSHCSCVGAPGRRPGDRKPVIEGKQAHLAWPVLEASKVVFVLAGGHSPGEFLHSGRAINVPLLAREFRAVSWSGRRPRFPAVAHCREITSQRTPPRRLNSALASVVSRMRFVAAAVAAIMRP